MSELGLPAEDKDHSGETDGRKQKILFYWREHFRFQPIRFCQSLLAQTDRQIKKCVVSKYPSVGVCSIGCGVFLPATRLVRS